MSDHKHGTMKTDDQEKTFNSFLKYAGWGLAGAMIFLFLLGLVNG